MPNYSYGLTLQKRVKRLLEAILAFVNSDLPDLELKDFNWRWKQEDGCYPELIIKTKLRTLIFLTQKDNYRGQLTKKQVNPILTHYLRDFLHILKDHRTATKGSEDWTFTLQLWSKEKSKNLQKFDEEWELKRPPKSPTKTNSREKIQEQLSQIISPGGKRLNLPEPPLPSHLLRAEFGVVPFIGRENTLECMLNWCKSSNSFSINVLYGQAGMGKTRLMREVCVQLEQEEWLTGFFRSKKDGNVADEASFQRMLELPFPFLLIIDYTENQYHNVETLLELVRERNQSVKFRLVLIARQLEVFREKIETNYINNGIFSYQLFLKTPLCEIEHKNTRKLLFETAFKTFCKLLNPEYDFQEQISLTHLKIDFSEDAFGRPLIVQLAALVKALGYQETQLESFFMCLISHEQRYWIRMLEEHDSYSPRAMERMKRSLEQLVTINTLLGGQTRNQFETLAKRMSSIFSLGTSELLDLIEIIGQCYEKESEIIDSLQPDLIGEYLIVSVLNKRINLLQNLLGYIENRQVKQVFDVLNRTAQHFNDAEKWLNKGLALNPSQFAPIMLTVSSETGGKAAKAITKLIKEGSLDSSIINKLEKKLPKYTIDLREARVLIVKQCLSYLTENDDILERERARLLAKLSAYQLELAQLKDAQENAKKAVNYYKIISQNDLIYCTNLAFSLNIYAVALQKSGQIRESENPARQAVELYKKIVDEGDKSSNLKLASSQNTLATILGETGSFLDALDLIESASKIYRKYHKQTSYAYTVELASCLSNKALLLRHVGKYNLALKTAAESTQLLQEFIKDKQGQCHSELAASLTELANRYYENGLITEALDASKEAENIWRSLVERKPEIFKKHLAKTLLNQANIIRETIKTSMAVEPAQEAVNLYQEIFNNGSREIAYEFITATSNLGNILREHRKATTAKELLSKSILLLSYIQDISGELSSSLFVNSVIIRHNLSLTLMDLGEYNEALKISTEALRFFIPEYEKDKTRYFLWKEKLVDNYKNACRESGQPPEPEFFKYLDI